MSRRPLVYVIALATAAFLIALSERDRWLPNAVDDEHVLAGRADCRPQDEECLAGDRQHGLSLRFPEPVRLLEPFPLEVRVRGMRASAVTVEFQMRRMDMGVNRVALASAGNGVWQGTATLPVCTTGRADWSASVVAQTGAGAYRARFGFVAGPH